MIHFSALTPDQRDQVADLFADDLFGKDAGAYLYEVSNGQVVRRERAGNDVVKSTARVKSINVIAVRGANVSAEQIAIAQMHMDALAVSIAEKLSAPIEVTNDNR